MDTSPEEDYILRLEKEKWAISARLEAHEAWFKQRMEMLETSIRCTQESSSYTIKDAELCAEYRCETYAIEAHLKSLEAK